MKILYIMLDGYNPYYSSNLQFPTKLQENWHMVQQNSRIPGKSYNDMSSYRWGFLNSPYYKQLITYAPPLIITDDNNKSQFKQLPTISIKGELFKYLLKSRLDSKLRQEWTSLEELINTSESELESKELEETYKKLEVGIYPVLKSHIIKLYQTIDSYLKDSPNKFQIIQLSFIKDMYKYFSSNSVLWKLIDKLFQELLEKYNNYDLIIIGGPYSSKSNKSRKYRAKIQNCIAVREFSTDLFEFGFSDKYVGGIVQYKNDIINELEFIRLYYKQPPEMRYYFYDLVFDYILQNFKLE